MSKPTKTIALTLTQKFEAAFPGKFLPEGIVDKGKTRIGITYTAFYEKRHTLVVIPGVSIIEDALLNYPQQALFAVMENVTVESIAEYLLSDVTYKKILTTSDSFGKVIQAAKSVGKLDWLFNEVFLYLDEYHCYAVEAFRENILTPFRWVWEFKRLAFGSASPFEYSDPRFAELPRYKLTYKEKFGTITIVHDSNPKAALHYMLTHPDIFPGKVFVFFNSVTEIGEAIREAKLNDVTIYCAANERNMVNLDDQKVHFKHQPFEKDFKKFNFFSCRYNEGWDLKSDEQATIILVTDVHIPNTLIGIPYKGFQAVGRVKVKPHNIYHITNTHGKTGMRTFKNIQSTWLVNADSYINHQQLHLAECIRQGVDDLGLFSEAIKRFSTINKEGVITIDYMKLDQLICPDYCMEHYNSRETLDETWKSLNYYTQHRSFDLKPLFRTKTTKEEINKQVISRYEELINHPERYVFEVAIGSIAKDKIEYQMLFEAYLILGKSKIEELKYNDTAMKQALIQVSSTTAEAKLRLILIEEYKLNSRHSKKDMKARLQQLYNELSIRKPNGKLVSATATKFEELGLFKLNDCKVVDKDGISRPGFEIVKLLYTIKEAA